jgi:hypothetical protein
MDVFLNELPRRLYDGERFARVSVPLFIRL